MDSLIPSFSLSFWYSFKKCFSFPNIFEKQLEVFRMYGGSSSSLISQSFPCSEKNRLWWKQVWDMIGNRWEGGGDTFIWSKGHLWGGVRWSGLHWIRRRQIWEQQGSEDSRQREQLVRQPEVEKRLNCLWIQRELVLLVCSEQLGEGR